MECNGESVILNKKSVITFALEIWRISNSSSKIKNMDEFISARYSLRKLNQILEEEKIEFIDLSGEKYDAGMAVDVVYTEGVEGENSNFVIEEMMEPIILLKEKVIHRGKVVIAAKQ
ncbi:MAG: hypothetical protein FH751_02530 [Firmicutes bacterium]|nr:hypothetical protein [Bacillota bacterium]